MGRLDPVTLSQYAKERTGMENFKEYDQYDGLGLADLIKKGEVSQAEVCEAAINRIESVNTRVNAVIATMYDIARAQGREPMVRGAFAGVPFLLKDLLVSCAGVPFTSGCKALRNYIPDHDSELVMRFKKAGVNILGKTNTPEFGLVAYTEPELHGPTRNPWNLNHTPGGSSGGSAAAVAAGMVPLAGGGDGGGSIRIPASCCGLFGLKPSRGRTPTGPDHGQIWQGASIEHVLTRSVRDSAAMLDAVSGPDIGAPYIIQRPERPYLEEFQRSPERLRIAFTTRSPLDTPVHPEYVKATLETALLLQKLGHDVDEAEPGIDGKELAASYMILYFGEVATEIDALKTFLGRDAVQGDVETLTWTLGMLGRSISAFAFVQAMKSWGKAARIMGNFHEAYDIYLTPTIAAPPIRIGELKPKSIEKAALKTVNTLRLGKLLKRSGVIDKIGIANLSKTPFTQLANFTGQPAMSVPLHWTSDGLPCGMHFMAKMGDEATLFRLAGQLEEAQPWFHKRPAGV
jgi:amidase